MRTPASISKHPIHPMLIVFPIGLWVFSLACDLIRLAGAPGDAWITVAYYSMVGGFIGALCAAVPGLIDLIYYKGGAAPVKKIALTHMTINLIVVALYAINIWLRAGEPSIKGASMSIPVLLSILGVALLCVSGWLGGQMVHVYGVGVEGRE
jgi:uncharacterized membrane protein